MIWLCWAQALAGQFADKAALLVDLNERALALRTGEERRKGGGGRVLACVAGPSSGVSCVASAR
jgi:hypothetical protein